jgi:hypothetical protein
LSRRQEEMLKYHTRCIIQRCQRKETTNGSRQEHSMSKEYQKKIVLVMVSKHLSKNF